MDLTQIKKKILEQISASDAQNKEELAEKIEAMNDEEIMAIANRNQCIFCSIASGEVETFKIYETPHIVAFLDINPASSGNMIVVPKNHFQFISQMPNDLVFALFSAVKFLSPLPIKLLGAKGTAITLMQGQGQSVPHVCVNITPRYENDKLNFDNERQKETDENLEGIAGKIKKEIAEYFKSLPKEKVAQEPRQQIKEQPKAAAEEGRESKKEAPKEEKKEQPKEEKKEVKNAQEGKRSMRVIRIPR
ncbi:MAG: HIT family protein [archaeon]